MKSMSDEIVSLDTVKAIEKSLRDAIHDQAQQNIDRIANAYKIAGTAIAISIFSIVVSIILFVFHH